MAECRCDRYSFPSYDTVEERAQRGKNARKRAPRASQNEYDPPADRPDPVDLLEQQAATRVPDLVPIRYGRMVESAFPFYRGAALLMASDLSHTPDSGLTVQACGDAHLANFGAFASPGRIWCSTSTTSTRPTRAPGVGSEALGDVVRGRRSLARFR